MMKILDMIYFKPPDDKDTLSELVHQSRLPYTYFEVNETRKDSHIKGFDNDRLRLKIGDGISDFLFAKQVMLQWGMLPSNWTMTIPEKPVISKDTSFVLMAKFAGLWWRNFSRIVYVREEPLLYGFAYGTLPGHMECGEELFQIEMLPDDSVWYEIRAFSRPGNLLSKICYPIIRRLQDKFRRNSATQLQEAISYQSRYQNSTTEEVLV